MIDSVVTDGSGAHPCFTESALPPAELCGAAGRVLAYWRDMEAGGEPVSWAVFSLPDMPLDVIPFSSVCDVLDGEDDYRLRFWGTQLTRFVGEELQGRFVTAIMPSAFGRKIFDTLNAVRDRALPYSSRISVTQWGKTQPYEDIYRYPLIDGRGRVTHIVSTTHFHRDYRVSSELFRTAVPDVG